MNDSIISKRRGIFQGGILIFNEFISKNWNFKKVNSFDYFNNLMIINVSTKKMKIKCVLEDQRKIRKYKHEQNYMKKTEKWNKIIVSKTQKLISK